MKKVLFLSFLLALNYRGICQVYLLQEFFNTPNAIPEGWKTIDQDGDGHGWHVFTFGTIGYAVSDSWIAGNTGTVTPNNFLVSPQISLEDLTGTVKLRYTLQIPDPVSCAEHYKVAVSTTGNKVSDFTNVELEETCTGADYYEVFPYWHERVLDITPYIGQKVYLAWCHYKCSNQYQLLLDSIQVSYYTNVDRVHHNRAGLQVYPNPANEKIIVEGLFESAEIQLFTTDGRQIFYSANQTGHTFIDVSDFKNGIYILSIQSKQGILTRKIQILHD